MGFQYSGDDLNTYKNEMTKSLAKLEELLHPIFKNAETAFQDPSWTGQTAQKFKRYYEAVYTPAAVQLSMLCSCLKNCLDIYYACYINFVDSDSHAVIYAEEIDKLSEKLQGRDTEAEAIQSALTGQIDTISEIADGFDIKDPGIVECVTLINQTIKDLYERIDCTEGKIQSDLAGILSASNTLVDLILVGEYASVSSDGKTLELDEERLSRALNKAMDTYQYLDGWKKENKELILKAEEIGDIDQATRQREGEASAAKGFTTGLVIVTNIGLICATGGGSLLLSIIYGAASGALISAVDEAGDQYAEKGWDNITWGDVEMDALFGGIGGAAGGGIGSLISSGLSTGLGFIPGIQEGLQSSKPAIQGMTQAMVDAWSTWVGDVVGGVVDDSVGQLLKTGEIDFGSAIQSSITDPTTPADTAVSFFHTLGVECFK